MKRGAAKKGTTERRKKPRSNGPSKAVKARAAETKAAEAKAASEARSSASQRMVLKADKDACYHCSKDLSGGKERALFVEEEIGRIFCSEECITAYFSPEIERLEKEYFRRVASNDLPGEERESLAHLRWITLQEPDEVWREKTLSGDLRYTMISEFQPGTKRIWCICICLFLRGEPSFLFLAFPTKNAAMLNHYRRGERVQWVRSEASEAGGHLANTKPDEDDDDAAMMSDRLADGWTEDETFLAQTAQERSPDDIPTEEYHLYQSCLEETLETPDEVWTLKMEMGAQESDETMSLYHFVRHYPDESPGVWFIIVARETEDEEQIEILDAFPTRDATLVERYRRGTQEVGQLDDTRPATRVVH